MTRGLFFTGTGTEVGKTYVAQLAARALVKAGHRVGVYKPVASGCLASGAGLVSDDAVALWEAAGKPHELDRLCPQRFAAPLAPHLAARTEGKQVDAQLLRDGLAYWTERSEIVLVEGAGGLMSPLTDDEYNADLAADLGFPLIVVAANELGTINATLQTLIAAAAFGDGLPVAGIVLNQVQNNEADASTASNADELAARCVPPLLGSVSYGAAAADRPIDWFRLARPRAGRDEDDEADGSEKERWTT